MAEIYGPLVNNAVYYGPLANNAVMRGFKIRKIMYLLFEKQLKRKAGVPLVSLKSNLEFYIMGK